MAKAIFYNVPAHGHVNPSLGLAAELVKRGEQVIYYLTDEFRGAVEATGAEFRRYDSYPAELLENVNGNPMVLAVRMVDACRQMLPGLLDAARAERPDYIVYDAMTPWGWQVAQALNLPSVSSMSLFAINGQVMFRSGKGLAVIRWMLSNLGNQRRYNQKAAELRRALNIPMPSAIEALNCPGALTLVYTSSLFQPFVETFDSSYQFVGPSVSERPVTSDFPFEQLSDQPLLYISLGTVNNNQRAFYQTCFEAFGGADMQVVLSIGRTVELASLGTIPANFIVRSHVPQLDILKRAAVFITHAGMNSVHEALWYNVPLVFVPQTLEQELVALQGARLGVGVQIDKTRVTADRLRGAVAQVLRDDSYRQNAARIGESFHTAGGYPRAVDAIFALTHSAKVASPVLA